MEISAVVRLPRPSRPLQTSKTIRVICSVIRCETCNLYDLTIFKFMQFFVQKERGNEQRNKFKTYGWAGNRSRYRCNALLLSYQCR